MPRTPRKQLTDRKKSGQALLAAFDTHGDVVADSLTEDLEQDLLDTEEMPKLRTFFRLLRRRLGRYLAAMVAAGQEHLDELADDAQFRALVEAASSAVTGFYIRLRDLFTGAYGAEAAAIAGFESRVAEDPAAVELQGQRLIDNLTRPDLELPEPVSDGVAIQPAEAVQILQPPIDRLRAARAALELERREAVVTLLAKNAAVEEFEHEFLWTARLYEASATLAGMEELAKRLRPSTRRPGRREIDVEAEEESTQAPETSPTEPAFAEAATDGAEAG